MGKENSTSAPSISYEGIIEAGAAEITARINLDLLAPEFRTLEHKARLHVQHIDSQRERFREWELLGNHFADALENPDTPAELYNIIGAELDELANRAGLSITSPVVLRLVYPWLRDRLFEKEVSHD
jgi:hypothetical protein